MTNLTPAVIDSLLRGASLLSCGGGLKLSEQTKLAAGKNTRLLDPDRLPATAWCATVSEVGAAAAPVMIKTKLPQAIKLLEAKTGKTIAALIPPEIGQEAIVIDAAAITGLPIIDSDLAGCRAVPRLDNLALVAQGIKFTMSPAVILTASGRTKFIPQQANWSADEARVRRLVPKGQVVTLIGGIVSTATIRRYLSYRSYTTAIKLGEALKKGQPLEQVLPTTTLFGPKTITIQTIQAVTSSGFDSKIVTMTIDGQKAKLQVENEYLKLQLNRQTFAFPQLIMVFDQTSGQGIHSSDLVQGKSYALVVADAFIFWKEPKI